MEGPSLYEQMLQHQSWTGTLGEDSDMGETPEEDQPEQIPADAPRGGFGYGFGGFGSGCGGRGGRGFGGRGCGFGGFGRPPFGPPHGPMPYIQMFMGPGGPPPPFGPPHGPPHGGAGPHRGPPGPPPHGGSESRHGHGHKHCHGGPPHGHGPHGRHCGPPGSPPVTIVDEKDKFVVYADVPGFAKADVKVMVADKKLTIKGELADKPAGDAHTVLAERRPMTSFDRSFQLADDIDAAKITAKLEHGLLRVVLPRKAGAAPKDVPVGAGSSDEEDFVAVDEGQEGAGANPEA